MTTKRVIESVCELHSVTIVEESADKFVVIMVTADSPKPQELDFPTLKAANDYADQVKLGGAMMMGINWKPE